MKTKNILLLSVSLLSFTGCSLAPEVQTPKMQLPQTKSDMSVNIHWWKNFNDENLNKLIEEALKNNDDLKIAAINVQKARAQYNLSEANLYPNISADATAVRTQKSKNTFGSTGATYNNIGLSASASYEVDLWGKLSNDEEASLASLMAIDTNKEAVKISLVTDVATYYFNIISINEQLKIAQESLTSYQQTLEYRQKQFKYGTIDELTVAQAQAQVAVANTLIQTIQMSKIKLESSLSLLVGRNPKEIFDNNIQISSQLPNAIDIPQGLPSKILENRPDIKVAQYNLKMKTSLIGVAKSAYFPSISLTGSYGFQSQDFNNLMNSSSAGWNFGPSINIPIFNFGRIEANVNATKAEQKAALVNYAKTVKNAYKEVFDSLNSIKLSKAKYESVAKEVDAYDRAYKLATKRFDVGTASYLDVLNAQNGLLNAKLSYVSINASLLIDQATLYKSLGGGWKSKEK